MSTSNDVQETGSEPIERCWEENALVGVEIHRLSVNVNISGQRSAVDLGQGGKEPDINNKAE